MERLTDHEILAAIRRHATDRLIHLARLIYHHECNVERPDQDEQATYLEAIGEQRALRAVQQLIGAGDDTE
jgi:hypothetical protein